MKNGAAALQRALFEALKNDDELIESIGGEHIYDHVPPKGPFPCVTLGETATRDWNTSTEAGGEHFLNILIWARESGRKRVLDIAAKIATRLDGMPVEVNGHRLVNLMLTEVLARNTDGLGSYLGTMRYRAVTEPVG
ncbi:hypothetical protein FHS76_003619 [Ochrobactrum daejeonense]|uniref:DUF3168 domain-containing protein n=1 Tax=Brucella daejeonensis TaxID=659015 RepID=A0A7W9EMR3_9HYPH|nr:DUF3168 domain-containing protein [Brucella daejeonensis]MBB5703709.1 hypothetical protein [Brucella daejeonensis]NKB78761.1 DUF3168 domain-containing protein [Brucella daejeonensis]